MPHFAWWTLVARVRTILGRRPWLFWGLVLAVGAAVALRVESAERAAVAAQRAWGRSRTAWVATAEVSAGGTITAEARAYPEAMLPDDALTAEPTGAAARTIVAGAVLTAADVATGGTPPADWVVLGLPADRAPALRSGDGAVLFGGGARRCDGVAVAAGAEVVEVAVPPECAPLITTDLAAGDVVVGRAIAG